LVEKIKNSSVHFIRNTGPIRISANDLIAFLSNTQVFEATTFEAECNGYSFESLEDMKANRELLAGRPTISGTFEQSNFRNFTITFHEGATINAYLNDDEKHLAILEKASENLNSFRGLVWVFKYISPFFTWVCIAVLASLIAQIYTNSESEISLNQFFNSTIVKIWLLMICIGIFHSIVLKRNSVFFGKKSQLWEKVKENTISHIIVFFLGIALTWFATKSGLAP